MQLWRRRARNLGAKAVNEITLSATNNDGLTSSGSPRRQRASRLAIEVITTSGRSAWVKFHTDLESVEVWYQNRCVAVFDREALATWLREPTTSEFVAGEVMFSRDYSSDRDGRVAISLPNVRSWTLMPDSLDTLRGRLAK